MTGGQGRRVVTKLRWWGEWWQAPGRERARVRYYGPGRQHHAFARAAKLRAEGYTVEIEQAPVGLFVDAEL